MLPSRYIALFARALRGYGARFHGVRYPDQCETSGLQLNLSLSGIVRHAAYAYGRTYVPVRTRTYAPGPRAGAYAYVRLDHLWA